MVGKEASHCKLTGLTPPLTGLTPSPSPRGEGSEMLCNHQVDKRNIQGFCKTLCYAAAKLINEICNVITRHITPLSPWRGAGGEAFYFWSGVEGMAFYYSVTAFSHHFSLTLQLLSGLFAAVYADSVFWITNETK